MRYLLMICLLGMSFSALPLTSAQADECGKLSLRPELIVWDVDNLNLDATSLMIADYLDAGAQIDDAAFQITDREFAPDTIDFAQYEIDVTGDDNLEIVVNLMFYHNPEGWPGSGYGFWAVYECQATEYEIIALEEFTSQNYYFDPAPGIIAVEDLTSDGIPELVVYKVRNFGTHAYHFKEVQIYQWNHTKQLFDPMLIEDNSIPATPISSETDIMIMDTTGDGVPEILAGTRNVNHYTQGYILPRNGYQVWEWQGLFFTNWCEIFPDEPVYRIQAVQDAGAYFDCRRYEDALNMYERILTDDSLLSATGVQLIDYYPDFGPNTYLNENDILTVYVHYRRMLLFIILEDMESARAEYEKLQNWTGAGSEYVELATLFWTDYEEYASDLIQLQPEAFLNACGTVNRIAEEKGIDSPLAVYPFSDVSPVTEVLCPFKQFAPISD